MVFTRFMAIYGHKFKSSFETEAEMRIAKREWAMSLGQYSENELVAAVNTCKDTMAWAPSIAEFITILQGLNSAFGLPDIRAAYKEACYYADRPSKHNWSHLVVYRAGKETGWFELRSATEKTSFGLFSYHYEIMCRRFRQGDLMDKPVAVAIEDKQDNTLFTFINQWSKEQQVSQEAATKLLYYMTKPQGSDARELYRAKSKQQIAQLQLDITLPE